MVHLDPLAKPTSESVDMYLLHIALLKPDGQAVPIPALAQKLSVSPVSANEMCWKMADRQLVEYEPYKGVRLTSLGQQRAQYVLHCRRLWEAFFAKKLGLDPHLAENLACRFEHVTPDVLAEQLAIFLGYSSKGGENKTMAQQVTLDQLPLGSEGIVVRVGGEKQIKRRLLDMGMITGTPVVMKAVAPLGDPLEIIIKGYQLSLRKHEAANILIEVTA